MDINKLTIAEAKELVAQLSGLFPHNSTPAVPVALEASTSSPLDDFANGQTVIVRTYSAGVWCGKLRQKAGKEVILTEARRMWRWQCKESISLSGVVCYGIDQKKSKIAAPVPEVWLEAIEIMPIGKDAAKTIMEAPVVEAE